MTARLRNHHVLLLGLGSAALAMGGCASPEVAHAVEDTKETTQASSVIVDMKDASGTSLGTCSGTLTSSKTVLTAGHCIAGVKSWSITSGSKTVKGSVGSTSWTTFGSDLSHPEHSDVGMIALDSEISLSSYPSIATREAADGTKGVQFFRSSATATAVSSASVTIQGGASKGFRLNYLISSNATFVDPGAAVLDANNNIIGVVSGKGKTSGMLHVARVENYRTWAKAAVTCASSLATRDWGSGNTDTGGAGYGGTPSTVINTGGWSGPTGSAWGSSSGGYGGGDGSGNGNTGSLDGGSTVPGYNGGTTTTPSGSSTSGGTTSGGTDTTKSTVNPGDGSNTCPGAPVCEGSDCGLGGSGLNGGTGATSPSGSGGSSTSTGTSTTTNNPDGSTTTTTTNPNGTTTTTTVTPGSNGSGSTSVSQTKNPDGSTTTTVTQPNGTTATTTTDANGNPIANPTSTTSTTNPSTGTGEGCSGSTDNNSTCPTAPDSASCAAATCGACTSGTNCADVIIDYGACSPTACGAAATTPAIK